MPPANRGEELLATGFFEGRLLVAIDAWDADLHLGIAPQGRPPELCYLQGLSYVRGFELEGRLLAPKAYRGRSIRVHLAPHPSEFLATAKHAMGVGQFYTRPENPSSDLSANLLMHEDDLSFAATCLSSIWKYLHIWISDEDDTGADITNYSFSARTHRNLDAWIAEE